MDAEYLGDPVTQQITADPCRGRNLKDKLEKKSNLQIVQMKGKKAHVPSRALL